MIDRSRFALNRILCPSLPLAQFFELAGEVGVGGVELRNDLPGVGVIDGLESAAVRDMADRSSLDILTINALQQFNLEAVLPERKRELAGLAELAERLGCRAIVLVPNNDSRDKRTPSQIFRETVGALKSFAPFLADRELLGYVEPLGFGECSLRSKVTALEAIGESGASCYRIVHDTFHHTIGPDTLATLQKNIDVKTIGLVHLSGVTSPLPLSRCRDEHRVLVTPDDRMESVRQVRILESRGYRGSLSFEPFAPEVQRRAPSELKKALAESMGLFA